MTGPPSGGPVGFSAVCPGFINRVGILGRVEDEIEIPPALGTMPPEAVGAAVVKAIVENKPELIVNKRPNPADRHPRLCRAEGGDPSRRAH